MGEPAGGLTLRRLLMWTLEPRARLQVLALLTHAAQEVYGGACVSGIYQVSPPVKVFLLMDIEIKSVVKKSGK